MVAPVSEYFNRNTIRAFYSNTVLLRSPSGQVEDQEITYGGNLPNLKTIWSRSLRFNSLKVSFSTPSRTDGEARRRLVPWEERQDVGIPARS